VLQTAKNAVDSYSYCTISNVNNNIQLKSVPVALSHSSAHYSAVLPPPFFKKTPHSSICLHWGVFALLVL